MPNIYCTTCKRDTAHKVIMRRCDKPVETLGEKIVSFTQVMAKFVSGDHYYEMEQQYICRCCNQPNEAPAKVIKRVSQTMALEHH